MIKYLDLLIGLLCVFYYLYLEIVYNGMAFDTFFMIIGSVLILYHFIKNKIHLSKNLKKVFNIPIYNMGNKSDIEMLCDDIINYF